jgi:hypothetical protein
MRWADLLIEFDFNLYYHPGKLAARLDVLSQQSQDMPSSIIDKRLTNHF